METEALRTLHEGFLYLVMGSIIVAVSSLLAPGLALRVGAGAAPSANLGLITALSVMLLIGSAFNLYAVLGKIRGGMRELSSIDGGFRISYVGTALISIGLVVSMSVFIALVVSMSRASAPDVLVTPGGPPSRLVGAVVAAQFGTFFQLIGALLTFVGGAFKLYGRYGGALFLAAGVLYVVDLLLAFLGLQGLLQFVGHVLMYIALGNAIRAAGLRAKRGSL